MLYVYPILYTVKDYSRIDILYISCYILCIVYNISYNMYYILGTDELPTVANIDTYMTKLHQLILDAPQVNEDLIVAVREVVNKLNLEAYVG